MVNKIHLQVAGLRFVPGDAPHRNVAAEGPIASLWPRPGETRFILVNTSGETDWSTCCATGGQ